MSRFRSALLCVVGVMGLVAVACAPTIDLTWCYLGWDRLVGNCCAFCPAPAVG